MYRGTKRFNKVKDLKDVYNHSMHRYAEFPGDCERCTREDEHGPPGIEAYGRAHWLNNPSTVDPILDVLKGVENIDIDGGPAKCTVRGYMTGRLWARDMTPELFEVQARLEEAGYAVKRFKGDETHPMRLVVKYG